MIRYLPLIAISNPLQYDSSYHPFLCVMFFYFPSENLVFLHILLLPLKHTEQFHWILFLSALYLNMGIKTFHHGLKYPAAQLRPLPSPDDLLHHRVKRQFRPSQLQPALPCQFVDCVLGIQPNHIRKDINVHAL